MRIQPGIFLLAALALLIAGCGGDTAAATKRTSTPAKTRPNAKVLAGYASLAYPALKGSVQQLSADRQIMQRANGITFSDAANQCVADGNMISGSFASFTGEKTPREAALAYHFAYQGFRLALSALDECGIAGDTGKRKAMETALKDMNNAITMLSHSEAIIAPWYKP